MPEINYRFVSRLTRVTQDANLIAQIAQFSRRDAPSIIDDVVFQGLHDHSIEKRAQLKVRMEEEQQKQDLTDSKLCNQQQTSVLRKII